MESSITFGLVCLIQLWVKICLISKEKSLLGSFTHLKSNRRLFKYSTKEGLKPRRDVRREWDPQPKYDVLSQRRSWLCLTLITGCLSAWTRSYSAPAAALSSGLYLPTWRNQRKCGNRAMGSLDVSGALEETDTGSAPCAAWFTSMFFLEHDENLTPP